MRLIARPPRAGWRLAGAGAAALVGIALAWPGRAQEAPVPTCQAATAGQLSRQVGVRCECRFFAASALATTPAGHRWDCGILRARLDDLPVDLNFYPYPLPDALAIERPFLPRPPPPRPWR
jgi:hypothetical protein